MCWFYYCLFFFFKQKTAYEMRISDWSSDVCSSDLSRVACGADFQSTLRIVAQGGGDRGGFGGVGTGVRRARRGERPALGGSSGHADDSVLARTPCQRLRTRLPLLPYGRRNQRARTLADVRELHVLPLAVVPTLPRPPGNDLFAERA